MGEEKGGGSHIGFFMPLSSSSLFQYRSHRYRGLLLPMSFMLRASGPWRICVNRASSRRSLSMSSSSLRIHAPRIDPASSSSDACLSVDGGQDPARLCCERLRIRDVKAPVRVYKGVSSCERRDGRRTMGRWPWEFIVAIERRTLEQAGACPGKKVLADEWP